MTVESNEVDSKAEGRGEATDDKLHIVWANGRCTKIALVAPDGTERTITADTIDVHMANDPSGSYVTLRVPAYAVKLSIETLLAAPAIANLESTRLIGPAGETREEEWKRDRSLFLVDEPEMVAAREKIAGGGLSREAIVAEYEAAAAAVRARWEREHGVVPAAGRQP